MISKTKPFFCQIILMVGVNQVVNFQKFWFYESTVIVVSHKGSVLERKYDPRESDLIQMFEILHLPMRLDPYRVECGLLQERYLFVLRRRVANVALLSLHRMFVLAFFLTSIFHVPFCFSTFVLITTSRIKFKIWLQWPERVSRRTRACVTATAKILSSTYILIGTIGPLLSTRRIIRYFWTYGVWVRCSPKCETWRCLSDGVTAWQGYGRMRARLECYEALVPWVY